MDSNLPALPPPDPNPTPDPATAAFKQLETEVGVVRRLVADNDPSPTLSAMVKDMNAMRREIGRLAGSPAMQITPDEMARQIAAAGKTARADDAAAMKQARERMDRSAQQMESHVGTAATIDEQRRRLVLAAGGGALAVAALMSFAPGMIARGAPERWHWPERMASHTLRLDRWGAGERLLATADPEHWRAVVLGNSIVQDNQDTIAACLRTAAKERKPVRCTVTIILPKRTSR